MWKSELFEMTMSLRPKVEHLLILLLPCVTTWTYTPVEMRRRLVCIKKLWTGNQPVGVIHIWKKLKRAADRFTSQRLLLLFEPSEMLSMLN
jgi:hypothetical protein